MDLSKFNNITLFEMDKVSLMKRVDTKFIFNSDLLDQLLPKIINNYLILDIDHHRLQSYKTNYFDDDKLTCYIDHHNRKQNRFKIRMREYVKSKLSFLEIKRKVKGQTVKNRILIESISEEIQEHIHFIDKNVGLNQKLQKTLSNTFDRITLVNKEKTERLTIDINLSFQNNNQSIELNNVAVAELKQKRLDRNSIFYQLMKDNYIRPTRISKYCIGLLLLDPLKKIKYNRFKNKLLLINNI